MSLQEKRPGPRFAVLLLLSAGATLFLKFFAFKISHSVGIFSDAAESLVNITAACGVLFTLLYAARPADRDHAYGHEKIEYFSSGFEGTLIILAALWIVYEAIHRFLHPEILLSLKESLGMVILAAGINAIVSIFLLKASRHFSSIVLEASARHLLADVWTTAGVIVGLILFLITDLAWLDPLIACAVAIHVIWSGFQLIARSFHGLMDHALPPEEMEIIRKTILHHAPHGQFHALRTRFSGPRRFIDFHLLMPGNISLQKAHRITFLIEKELESKLHPVDVTIHMEPIEDPSSWDEESMSRRLFLAKEKEEV